MSQDDLQNESPGQSVLSERDTLAKSLDVLFSDPRFANKKDIDSQAISGSHPGGGSLGIDLSQNTINKLGSTIGQAVSHAMINADVFGAAATMQPVEEVKPVDVADPPVSSTPGQDGDSIPEATPQELKPKAISVIVESFGAGAERELGDLFAFDKIKSLISKDDIAVPAVSPAVDPGLLTSLGGGVGLAGAGLGAGIGLAGAGVGHGVGKVLEGGGGLLEGAGAGIGNVFKGISSLLPWGGASSTGGSAGTAVATGGEVVGFEPGAERQLIGIVRNGVMQALVISGAPQSSEPPGRVDIESKDDDTKEIVPAPDVDADSTEVRPVEIKNKVIEVDIVKEEDAHSEVVRPIQEKDNKLEQSANVVEIPQSVSAPVKVDTPSPASAPAKAKKGDDVNTGAAPAKDGLLQRVGAAVSGFSAGFGRTMLGAYTGGLSEKYFEHKEAKEKLVSDQTAAALEESKTEIGKVPETQSSQLLAPSLKTDEGDDIVPAKVDSTGVSSPEPKPVSAKAENIPSGKPDPTIKPISDNHMISDAGQSSGLTPVPIINKVAGLLGFDAREETPQDAEKAQANSNEDVIQELKSGRITMLLEGLARDISELSQTLPAAISSIQSNTTVLGGAGGGSGSMANESIGAGSPIQEQRRGSRAYLR